LFKLLFLSLSNTLSLGEVNTRKRVRTEESRDRTLNWISTVVFEAKYRETLEKHHPGTGTWLLGDDDFKRWSEIQGRRVFWCSGIPGAGKTVIASLVIQYLLSICHVNRPVVYIFCDYKARAQQTLLDLISSITRQMAEQSQTFFDHIRRNFSARISESDERTDTLTLVEHYALLKSEILSTDSAYFVVDALDELPDVNEEGEETRAELLDILGTLSQKHQLFMTSRPHIKNPLSYDSTLQLIIEANADDLRLFITSKIAKSRRLASFTKTDKSLEAEIIKAITQKASGM
jgi:hypothetical protein